MKKKLGYILKRAEIHENLWQHWKCADFMAYCILQKNKNPINNLYIRVLLKRLSRYFQSTSSPIQKKSHWSKKDANGAICRVLVWLKRRFNFCHFFPLRRTKWIYCSCNNINVPLQNFYRSNEFSYCNGYQRNKHRQKK